MFFFPKHGFKISFKLGTLKKNPSIFHELENSDHFLLCTPKFSMVPLTFRILIKYFLVSLPVISLPKSHLEFKDSVFFNKFWKTCVCYCSHLRVLNLPRCVHILLFVLDSRYPNKSRTSRILGAIEISSTGTATVVSTATSLASGIIGRIPYDPLEKFLYLQVSAGPKHRFLDSCHVKFVLHECQIRVTFS